MMIHAAGPFGFREHAVGILSFIYRFGLEGSKRRAINKVVPLTDMLGDVGGIYAALMDPADFPLRTETPSADTQTPAIHFTTVADLVNKAVSECSISNAPPKNEHIYRFRNIVTCSRATVLHKCIISV